MAEAWGEVNRPCLCTRYPPGMHQLTRYVAVAERSSPVLRLKGSHTFRGPLNDGHPH